MNKTNSKPSYIQYLLAWFVHVFTALGAVIGILTLIKIHDQDYKTALLFMLIGIMIDSVDGTMARLVNVKKLIPNFDGALLDNIIDYLNFVVTPAFFVYCMPNFVPASLLIWIVSAVVMSSAYQFCQADAKTPDHFFKGFPSHWNTAVFLLFLIHLSPVMNALILLGLCVLVFIPVKYVYPSRLDNLTSNRYLKWAMHGFVILFLMSWLMALRTYPTPHLIWIIILLSYTTLYFILSFYRTLYPLNTNHTHE